MLKYMFKHIIKMFGKLVQNHTFKIQLTISETS